MVTSGDFKSIRKINFSKCPAPIPREIKLSQKEHRALEAIYKSDDKIVVFEMYLKYNPEIAWKYLSFIAGNLWVYFFLLEGPFGPNLLP